MTSSPAWRTPSGALGGVTRTVVIDNLRAAVKHPDWYDPELVPRLEAFCQHYGTVILPTKPYTPRHKGKIERGIDYVKDNGLKGHAFPDLAAAEPASGGMGKRRGRHADSRHHPPASRPGNRRGFTARGSYR